MSSPFIPDKSPDPTIAPKGVEPIGTPSQQSQPGNFAAHMKATPNPTLPSADPSPMALATPAAAASSPTPSTLLAAAKGVQDSLGAVSDQLQTQNLKLKRSQTHLLRNKLHNANGHIRSAAGRLGVETPPDMAHPTGPLARFLSYINDGQSQLLAVQGKIKDLSSGGAPINPADLLAIQVKMNQAQQEIEYSSTLLSNVISGMKTVMNVQL